MPSAKDYSDLIGQTFWKLTVTGIGFCHDGTRNRRVAICKCECGNATSVQIHKMLAGKNMTCGCALGVRRGCKRRYHRSEHGIYTSMLARCNNPNAHGYAGYGGRGIRVCPRWNGENGFDYFLQDMGDRPTPEHTLDRIDNNGNYEPNNCRWATRKEQRANQGELPKGVSRRRFSITYNGVTDTARGWGDRLGIHRKVIALRLKAGWTMEQIIAHYNCP